MKIIRNQLNYVRIKPLPLLGLSMTIPDATMSISEIMLRFARGMPLGGRPDVYYDEDNEFDTERDYDLTELQEMQMQHKANYEKYADNAKKFKEKLDAENEDKKYYSRLNKEGYAKNISQKPPENV